MTMSEIRAQLRDQRDGPDWSNGCCWCGQARQVPAIDSADGAAAVGPWPQKVSLSAAADELVDDAQRCQDPVSGTDHGRDARRVGSSLVSTRSSPTV